MKASAVLAVLQRTPAKAALIGEGITLTYHDLHEQVERLAAYLKGNNAVAIHIANSPAWMVADLACLRAEVVCVPLPPFFTKEQIEHALRDAGASLILTDQPSAFNHPSEALEIAGQAIHVVPCNFAPVHFPHHTAKITYTSGTTGTPKGVCLTQAAMETVAASLLSVLGEDIADRHICLLPLAVLLENVAGVYTALLAGGTCYLSPVRHEPEALSNAIHRTNATSCILVPELLRMLIAAANALPSLKFAAVGGARVDPALLEAAYMYGIPVYEGYGLSEASSVVTVSLPYAHRPGSAGRPLPHITLKVSPEGEIMLKNPLYSGYLGDANPPGDWYATGDLGRIDKDGFVYIEGRKRNVFITSHGRNVSPEWPESLLTVSPAIAQAAVFGEAKPFNVAVIVSRQPNQVAQAVAQANARLPDYAQIGTYILAESAFTLENGQLTGTGRNRRDAIAAAYAAQIEACYIKKRIA